MPAIPKVSIGLPCFNEAPYIEQTLLSLLNQTETDFELLVCDNASTDGTLDVVKRVAAKDDRVRIHPSESNMGAIANFARAMNLATAPYFMWAGGHDFFAKEYVKKLRLVLDADPLCSLAYADSIFTGQDGSDIPGEPIESGLELFQASAAERFKIILWKLRRCDLVHGLMRRSMADPGLMTNSRAPDKLVLAGLALNGKFRRVPELLFYRRRNRGTESREQRKEHLAREGFVRQDTEEENVWRELRNSYIALLDHPQLSARERRELGFSVCQAFKEFYRVPWDAIEAATWHERLRLRFAKGEALERLRRSVEDRVLRWVSLGENPNHRAILEREVALLQRENHKLRRELAKARKES